MKHCKRLFVGLLTLLTIGMTLDRLQGVLYRDALRTRHEQWFEEMDRQA